MSSEVFNSWELTGFKRGTLLVADADPGADGTKEGAEAESDSLLSEKNKD